MLRIIIILWILSEIALSGFLRSKDPQSSFDKSSLKILWITICLSVTIGNLLSDTNYLITNHYYTIIETVGTSLLCIGLIIRWIAILKLGEYFTTTISVSDNQTIVQSGIYKHIRHPSYLGTLMSFLGLGIVFNNWITLTIIFVPILIAFIYRITIEEKMLKQVFGNQYKNYIKHSWKLIPKLF